MKLFGLRSGREGAETYCLCVASTAPSTAVSGFLVGRVPMTVDADPPASTPEAPPWPAEERDEATRKETSGLASVPAPPAREAGVSPQTRSPVTYAGLLPAVGEGVLAVAMNVVMDVLLAPPCGLGRGAPAGAGVGSRRPPDWWETCQVGASSAGTPNGCGSLGGIAGTDERSFRRPPDLMSRCGLSLVETRGWIPSVGSRDVLIGTEEHRFRRPPDLAEGGGQLGCAESFGVAGTEVRGFRGPPDDG